jgi:pyridoxine 5-phosphate synthase
MPATRSPGGAGAATPHQRPRQRLYINVDHVATIRQARKTDEPDPVAAAAVCEAAGADGITAHLREDRRHMQDADIERLVHEARTVFNLEMAATEEMAGIAERLRPFQVTLVPERREEVTTEGGLDVVAAASRLEPVVRRLAAAGIRVSVFIDPDLAAVDASHRLGAQAIELHTGRYAHAAVAGSIGGASGPSTETRLLADAARRGHELGLAVHAGHGLTLRNVGPVAAIPEIEELNIGHSIISRAVFVGLAAAVREMRVAMDTARSSHYIETEPRRT